LKISSSCANVDGVGGAAFAAASPPPSRSICSSALFRPRTVQDLPRWTLCHRRLLQHHVRRHRGDQLLPLLLGLRLELPLRRRCPADREGARRAPTSPERRRPSPNVNFGRGPDLVCIPKLEEIAQRPRQRRAALSCARA
jgi:hypothetical protein